MGMLDPNDDFTYNTEERDSKRIFGEKMRAAQGIYPVACRAIVYKAIDSERDYQDILWSQHDDRPGDGPNKLTIGEQLLLAEEYLARARAIWTAEKKPERKTLHFVRKVAGICVNCMEQHGSPFRGEAE